MSVSRTYSPFFILFLSLFAGRAVGQQPVSLIRLEQTIDGGDYDEAFSMVRRNVAYYRAAGKLDSLPKLARQLGKIVKELRRAGCFLFVFT